MRILMVTTSVLGSGKTSGSSVRADRFQGCFIKMGHKVERIKPWLKRKLHPLLNFIINFIMSLGNLRKSCDVVYSISDLFPDAAFGIAYKLTHPDVKFICGVHSLVQRGIKGRSWFHAAYSYYSQYVILALLKRTADKVLVSNNYDNFILKNNGHKHVTTVYPAPNF